MPPHAKDTAALAQEIRHTLTDAIHRDPTTYDLLRGSKTAIEQLIADVLVGGSRPRNARPRAEDARVHDEPEVLIMGDLETMSRLSGIVRRAGIPVEQRNVYPCVVGEDNWKRALRSIHGLAGAEQYRRDMLRFGICSEDEWQETYACDRAARSRPPGQAPRTE